MTRESLQVRVESHLMVTGKSPALANPLMPGMKFGQHILKYHYGSCLALNYVSATGKVEGYSKSLFG